MRHASWLVVPAALAAATAWGQPAPTHYEISADVPVSVGGVTAADADVVDLGLASGTWSALHTLSTVLPAGVGVDAIHCYSNGDIVFSPDTTFSWSGGSAGDEDLVLYSGGTFSLLFDGSAAGIPAGVGLDAVTMVRRTGTLEFLFSVDTDTTLGGASVTDDDIVRFVAPSSFAVAVPGSTWLGSEQGRVDVDGLAAPAGGSVVYVSLDVAATVGSLTPDDEDVVVLVNGSPSGTVDLSARGFPGAGADVDGLDVQVPPELSSASVDYAIVNTATAATWTVTYLDRDGDPPAAGTPSLAVGGASASAMNQAAPCGSPWCDGEYANSERFELSQTVGYGASHTWTISAGDGVDSASPVAGSGPSWVSTPGDADGDTDHDATDLAVILIEVADDNGGSNLDLVRSGTFTSSWGGTDADSNHQVTAADLPAAVAAIY